MEDCFSGVIPSYNTQAVTRPQSERTLWMTFAAPPSRELSEITRKTGTGASGEIRSTSHQTNRSNIRSPTTSRWVLRNFSKTSRSFLIAKCPLPHGGLDCSNIIGCPIEKVYIAQTAPEWIDHRVVYDMEILRNCLIFG